MPLTEADPALLDALDALVEPQTRLRWTTKSTRNLAGELGRQGHRISHHSVGRLLAGPLGYSLQANAKTVEGKQHPDRDAQFGLHQRPGHRCPRRGRAGNQRRCEEEGTDRRVRQQGPDLASGRESAQGRRS
jgi:hypothetical protein